MTQRHKRFGFSTYWFESGFYTLLQQLFTVLFGFGSFYVLVRVLTKDEFGAWSLFFSITALVEVTRAGLIQNAQIKFTAASEESIHSEIMMASFALNILFSVVAIGLLLVAAPFISDWSQVPLLRSMLFVYTFSVIAHIPFSQFNYIQQAHLNMKAVFYSNFIKQGFFFVAIVCFGWFHLHIELQQLVWLLCLSAVLGSGVSFFLTRKYLVFSRNLNWFWVKKLFHYGKFSLGTNVGAMLSGIINQVMLSGILSPASVAIYGTALRVNSLVELPVTTVATVVFPQSAKRVESGGKEAVKYLYEKSVGWLLAFSLPAVMCVLLFSTEIISFIAGANYLEAVEPLRISILLILLVPFTRQFGVMMDSIGKPALNFYMLLGQVIINVLFVFVGIKTSGLMGAVYGSFLALCVGLVINLYILHRELNVRFMRVLHYLKMFYVRELGMLISKGLRLPYGR
ncbi:MAG: flippase [Bacteroidota bacterium]